MKKLTTKPGPEFDRYRAAVSAKGFKFVSPFRLGVAVGEAGASLPNPYSTAKAANSFDQGVQWGRQRRRNGDA